VGYAPGRATRCNRYLPSSIQIGTVIELDCRYAIKAMNFLQGGHYNDL